MKLAYFDDFKLGVVIGDEIADVSEAVSGIPHVGPHDLISRVIERFSDYRNAIENAANSAVPRKLESVRLRPPLPRPGKIFNMAVNYLENGAVKTPPQINGFLKSPNCVIGDGDTVILPDTLATIFHHEAELALVIGKKAKNVKAADAYSHVFGYINFVDASARGLGTAGMDNFLLGKSWDTFGPMGPYLVTADEIENPLELPVQFWTNGEIRQNYNTNDMAYKIPEAIEWATSLITLNPGDIVSLGTNHQGIGPMQDGDKMEMEISGLGRLHFNVSDPLKRSWPKGIDHEMADRMAGRTST
jgi:2-keto-4-pentenoate hydratase/2-oxohepta-3-ene-1,7-dioic acid hydratase in catechol pathway